MTDIKDWLVAAAGTLSSGQVIKPSTLSYLDAMNALVMMDPAMDVGGTVSPVGQFDPHAVLSPHELMWIMDEMAARELAWLRGSTMAQTIFTSLHYHNALELRPGMTAQDPRFEAAEAACVALRAFVLAFAKSVDLVYAAFLDTNGPARDGEDVWLDPYGIPLETTETPDEVVAYLDQITLWLEDRMEMEAENGWEQVVMRLRFRKAWINALQLRPARPPPRAALITSTATVPWAFDNVTPFLRQSMPYPTVKIPDHDETWTALSRAMIQLQGVHAVARLSLAQTEQFLRSRVDDMLPIVRCVYKAVLCDTPSVDGMLDEWLVDCGEASGVLVRIDAMVMGQERAAFALWRDIVGGTLHLTLAAPLTNPARRRRAFMHLSESWAQQAQAGTRVGALAPLLPYLRARAIDCALYAHLLGFPLQLYTPGEMRAAWWATLVLARARREGGWEGIVAKGYAAIAAGMVLLYTLSPQGREPTTPQFLLRHKTLVRSVGMSVAAWERARKALDASALDVTKTLSTALDWFIFAETALSSPTLGPELDIKPVLADLAANIAWLRAGVRSGTREWAWGTGKSRVVPVLQ